MAVARMKKVTVFASREIKERLFGKLRDLGIMQVTRETHQPVRLERSPNDGFSAEISKLTYLKDYFLKYNPSKKSFIDMFTGKRPEVTLEDLYRLAGSFDIDNAFNLAREHEVRLRQIGDVLSSIENNVAALMPWSSLDIPLDLAQGTPKTEGLLAVLPLQAMPGFAEAALGLPVHWEKVWEKSSSVGLWLVGLKQSERPLASLVSGAGGSVVSLRVDLPVEGGLVAEKALLPAVIDALGRREKEFLDERDRLVEEDTALSQQLTSVLALIDYYLDKKNLGEVQEGTGRTQYTLIVEGWVKARDVKALHESLEDLVEVGVVEEDPAETDDVPIYLENNAIIRPFEVITNIFGYPKYNDIDPTPFLAPFFWIFFGICLGDAVYGIVLSLGAWYFLRSQKLADGGQKLVKLLMYSGVSTVIVGALTASWMSDLATAFFPGTIVERFVNSLAVINPVADPLTMLVVSFGFGLIQVWVGIALKMFGFFRQGQVAEGIISQGSWLLFLPGLVAWALSKGGLIRSNIPLYAMGLGAFMVMYSASRGQKNILLKPFSGLYGLYGTVSYFADTMSYSRLLALGLASTIIGVVVNKIAVLTKDMIPVVGWVLVPVILVGGHLFNLVINVLGSFIHAGRLQFVEFFTKFFEGGGRPFKPLVRVTENVSVED